MRHNQNRRSRSRNRKGPNPLTRSYESNGPDVKVRGNAAHVAEKYMSLARDAQSSGDIVAAEAYLQHAEHYNRIVMAAQAQFQQERPLQFRDGEEGYEDGMNGRGMPDRFDDGGRDDDEGDDRFDSTEEEMERTAEPRQPPPRMDDRDRPRGSRPDQRFGNQNRNDRNDRNDRGGDRGGGGDRQQRPDRPNFADRPNPADRPNLADRPNAGDRGERNDRGPDRNHNGQQQRFDRPDDRGARNGAPERFDRPDERADRIDRFVPRDEPSQAAPQQASEPEPIDNAVASLADDAPAPRRRRGRPPRVETAAPADGGEQTPDGAAALVAFPE